MFVVVDDFCRGYPLLVRSYLKDPLVFLRWKYWYFSGPFLDSLC